MSRKWWIVCLAMLGLTACETPVQEPQPTIRHITYSNLAKAAEIADFDSVALSSEIQDYITYFESENESYEMDSIWNYYAGRGFQPYWIVVSDTQAQTNLLQILASADEHGLDKNTYHYKQLETNLENLSFFFFQSGEINYPLWAESEILLADGLVLLAKHLKQGVFDPMACEDYHYFIPPTDTSFNPFLLFSTDSLEPFFQSLLPQQKQYKLLQKEYAKRLKKPETSRSFRDKDTLNKLRVNLERWRWEPLFTNRGRTVYINIPAFQLQVYKSDSVLMSSKVCVGIKRPKRYADFYQDYLQNPTQVPKPRHNETPILKTTISYLVLNPEWRVPSTIAKTEILQNIQKNPNYLDGMGYHIYYGNRLIDPQSVNWHKVTAKNFPYRIEQAAGDMNALGKIKFMFPNNFSVYLHDTPSKGDYKRRNRALTHGCVRVENYLELAACLLADTPKYDLAYLRKTIGLNERHPQKLKTINLFFNTRNNVDARNHLIIDYKTAWVNEAGQLQCFPDVYERDKLVLEALH